MTKHVIATIFVFVLLFSTVVSAGEVVINIRTIAINEVYNPLAASEGVFVRQLPVQPSKSVATLEKRSGFVLLEPQDAKIAVPRLNAEPELVVDGLRFIVPYALIDIGQRLFIKNKTAYDLTFVIKFNGHSDKVKVLAGKRVGVSIVGTKDGIVQCVEFPHLKAFVFRAKPGYLLKLTNVKEGDNKVIAKSIIDGPYKLRIWIGRWWETQPVVIEGERTVVRVDIDGTSKSKLVEAIVNPPDETILAEPQAQPIKQKTTLPQPEKRPLIGAPPAPQVEQQKTKQATQKPQIKAKPAATKPKILPKPAKKVAPKPTKQTKHQIKPAQKAKPAGGFKIKKVVEEKKEKPKPKAKEKKKPSGGGFFKIKKIEGE